MRVARTVSLAAGIVLASVVAASAGDVNRRPSFVSGEILRVAYDGIGNDLLTGGLGKTGLQAAAPPPFANALAPTAAELRTRAIHSNYRALVDMTTNGGYGVLDGPNIDLHGANTLGEGKIAGDEFLAFAGPESGRVNVTMMVQVPAGFDPARPCIVTATSSGSRGVYGAIGSTGEWGLKRGCAVAYTDKGTGNGAHDLQNNTVNLIDGTRTDAVTAGKASHFTAPISEADRAAFNAAFPNRFAFKHAHSGLNPEKEWGRDTLRAIELAFFVLNEQFGAPDGKGRRRVTITKRNTVVIASSVSNGGGAAIAAAEEDRHGLIDAVVVLEPQIQLPAHPRILVTRGGVPVAGGQKTRLDYTTIANLYEPCAALAPETATAAFPFLFNFARGANRCAALKRKGLLAGNTTAEQGSEALAILKANGWEADSDLLHTSHYSFSVAPAMAVTYANAHGRSRVQDNLCGFSYGATGAPGAPAAPAAAPAAAVAAIFATGNGIPPTSGINLINNLAVGGPRRDDASVSPSTGAEDFNVDGALCLRELVTGDDRTARRVQRGIDDVLRDGDLRGKPAIIVHGRSDALVPVNHTSRPYLGLNRRAEGARSRLRYYEVTNAQHFEAFLPLAGYDTRFVPLHVYGIQALNLMYAHLTSGPPLPPSHVVRTVPRGGAPGAAPPITPANVPPISTSPAAGDLITVSGVTVHVPD